MPAAMQRIALQWLATVVALVAAVGTPAMELRPLVLKHLTMADGLPTATVMTTLRDSQGFVWLGTEDGLVRFDGQKLVRYAPFADGRPGFIWQVVEDAHHDLWIADGNHGVARWRRSSDRFDLYQPGPPGSDSLASDQVRALLIDRQGRVWIGTSNQGIDILDPATGRIQRLRHSEKAAGSLSSNNVFTLRMDRVGDVWIGTADGLDRWERSSDRITRLGTGADSANLRTRISQVLENPDGSLWIGSNAGLARIERDGRVLRYLRHEPRAADSLSSDDVRALLRDAAGNLWAGTAGGLDLLAPDASGFQHYQHDKGDATTLRASYIMSLYQDPGGLIWVGTRDGGVSRWDPRSWEMGGARPGWLHEQAVMGFAEAGGREVWIASLAGLFRYNVQTGEATGIDAVAGRRDALGNDQRVMSLRADHAGSLWIGTQTAGLKRLRPDNRLQSFAVAAGKPRSLSESGIMSITEARDGRIWVGTFGGGANIVDPVSGEIRQLPFGAGKPGAVSGANVTAILEDAQGNFWIGTDREGLNLASATGEVLRVFRRDSANPHGLPSDTIYSLDLDSQGRVWIGTDAGVAWVPDMQRAVQQQEIKAVSLAREQSSHVVWGVVGDPRGGVWISGNVGLTWFDPDTGASRAYHREDGLQGEEFSYGAALRLRDGRLCFGGPGGFNIFDPMRLSGPREPPALLLTNALVNDLPVDADKPRPAWMRTGLSLGYGTNTLALDFAVLDFAAPEHSRLSYRLPGVIDQWQNMPAGQRILLMSLAAGDHVLEVRAASADSPWTATPLRFALHQDPKPWLTPWAFGIYALLLGLAVALPIRHQRRKFREMQRTREYLEVQVRERTSELVDSNRQLAEAARAKSDFLDRMSHELRTPMNGVVGMTELLSRTSLSATQTHLTKTIRASAQILLQIVNDLLDLSKIRAGKVELEALPVDIGQVLEECTSLFAGAAEAKGLELVVCPPTNARRVLLGDPLRVRQVLMNLVGNAVKFTAQGEIVVRADVQQLADSNAMVRLSVSDTGVGMDEATLTRIFEPFTQADEKTTRQFGGTGLGLAICRELAELMGGQITVESRQQVGSTFCLHLPMQLGAELPAEPQLPVANASLYTRRPSLADAVQRHCAGMGLPLTWDPAAQDIDAHIAGPLLIDASTHELLLAQCLAMPGAMRATLIAIATPAEAERLGLRLLLPEKAIVLKPVHQVALREALATVMGMPGLIAPAAPQREQIAALRGHVLLVEDDAVNAAVAQGYLAEIGCTCAWVTSAEAAIARNQTEHFDLVFMDLNMSDMDGFAATARIRAAETAGSRLPIVALTAHDAHSYRARVLQAGMDEILSKPYTLQDCRTMLARWLPAQEPSIALANLDGDAVQALNRIGNGGKALHARLAAIFERSSQPLMARLESALREQDLQQAADICHTLKSSAANVGGLAFAAKLRELEQHCRTGNAARATADHRELAAAYEPLLMVLRSSRMAVPA